MTTRHDKENLGEAFEVFIRSGKDKRGRVTGYVVGLRGVIDTNEYYAWVQRSIETPDGWKDFGTVQRSRKFPSLKAAKVWAYATAKERAERAQNQ